jgi:hypothetical protein
LARIGSKSLSRSLASSLTILFKETLEEKNFGLKKSGFSSRMTVSIGSGMIMEKSSRGLTVVVA